MALIIRLRQQGKTNRKSYRLVVADSRSPRDGKYLENLGMYDPHEDAVTIKADRIKHWLENGALISDKAKALVLKKAPEIIHAETEKKQAKKLKENAKKKESRAKKTKVAATKKAK